MKNKHIVIFLLLFSIDLIAIYFFGGLEGGWLFVYRLLGIIHFGTITKELYEKYKVKKDLLDLLLIVGCLFIIGMLTLSLTHIF